MSNFKTLNKKPVKKDLIKLAAKLKSNLTRRKKNLKCVEKKNENN